MNGSYDFTKNNIDSIKSEIGNYALGHITKKNKFRPEYVGRSDSNLRDELIIRLNTHRHHKKFKYRYADSKKEAFEMECKNFHEFKPSENENHPAKPDGTDLKCPLPEYHQ